MKIGMLLPTCEPSTFKNIFLATVEHLIGAKDNLVFAINYQEPWTKEELDSANKRLENMGFEVRYTFNHYDRPSEGHIFFNKIRYDCAVMAKDCEIMALCDDDFEFIIGADKMMNYVIENFEFNQRLGVLQCNQYRFMSLFDNKTHDPMKFVYFTGDGLFFRNIYKDTGVLCFPEEALDKVGAGEEFVIGYTLTKFGYLTKTLGNSKIRHRREVNSNNQSPYGWDKKEVVMNEVNGISPYIYKLFDELKELYSIKMPN